MTRFCVSRRTCVWPRKAAGGGFGGHLVSGGNRLVRTGSKDRVPASFEQPHGDMFLSILLATTLPSDATRVRTESRASVRIVKPAQVSAKVWHEDGRRRERVIIDRDGRRVLLRTVDYE